MNLKTLCTTAAIALAALAVSPLSFADELAPTQQQTLSIADQIDQLRTDIDEERCDCNVLSERIDALVKHIDVMLDAGEGDHIALIKQRKIALDLRLLIKCDHTSHDSNGTMLASAGAACNSCGPGACAPAPTGVVSFASRGAGGAGGAGGGALGSAAVIGGIAAAIAIPIATTSGSSAGFRASPSEIEIGL